MSRNTITPPPISATVLGYPRIGRHRELKRAMEKYWSGGSDRVRLDAVAADLRRSSRADLFAAGLDSVPVNIFSYYDQVLDTAVLLGAVPERFADIADPLDRYFAMARGAADLPPLEMTKWFDTNYHYLVPEISASTTFSLHPEKVLADLAEAVADGVPARPVVLGPVSFLLLAKAVDGRRLLDRVDELVPLYVDLMGQLAAAGAGWVQLDEPTLVQDRSEEELALVAAVYDALAAVADRPALLVASYFGDLGPALPVLAGTGIDGLAMDLVAGTLPAGAAGLGDKLLVAGVVDGRNIWRTDPDLALQNLAAARQLAGSVAVSTSCSLLHVPYGLAGEDAIDPKVARWLAFADEKVAEVVALAASQTPGADSGVESAVIELSRSAVADRAASPIVHRDDIRRRVVELTDDVVSRGEPGRRRELQAARLGLPALPTTTIGSFPQTAEIRRARGDLRAGRIDDPSYVQLMCAEVVSVIKLQEDLGLDVLVHGEPERNDMVQYFAEQLDGFAVTGNGWVQSYGSRCVRPPILFGDVSRPRPMTVEWASYAQRQTERPVKGMLTGPVTILAWSFVRDDQPLADTAAQVALAVRDETVDLEAAGIGIVQVDEPALRELLPLRRADWSGYLEWAVRSFRIATSGVGDATQIHTHLCYSEFGDVIDAIVALDADVTSVEAARSRMEILDDLSAVGYRAGIGPGVYDIHSPRVPSQSEIEELLDRALRAVGPDRLWVNPDCGLKTRSTDEATAALKNLVAAARSRRAAVPVV
ncbi:5-methyltetrahydropteroyltriglutamate--homocysteine S-methyltransferase [Nakamurella lactea]|uniref:5-methyltetrahydropteroyltriglutamate-- homocysteine S-methyltransferase n=1 Tax=Nakamurella lactea TaxID=459515 RepID=UPI00049152F8|nr:5-methyltetrahydropteroyltriglutamate--homocysteine S-methyltransferase [Nakamurella lactea]